MIPQIISAFDLNFLFKKIVLESRFFIRNLSRALTEEIPESGRASSRHLFFAHKKAIGRNDGKATEFCGLQSFSRSLTPSGNRYDIFPVKSVLSAHGLTFSSNKN